MQERFFSTYQVAELLGSDLATVRDWIDNGWLSSELSSDGTIHIGEAALRDFLQRRGIRIESIMAEAAMAQNDPTPSPSPTTPAPDPVAQDAGGDDTPARLTEAILRDAAGRQAEAIHLDPEADALVLRMRVDGVLHEKVNFRLRLPKAIAPALLERLKELAGLDPAPSGKAQQGSFERTVEGRNLRFDLHTWPVTHGQRIVIHIADAAAAVTTLDQSDFVEADRQRLLELLSHRSGLVLSVGPRRQRVDLMHLLAHELNDGKRAILAIESPAASAPRHGVAQARLLPEGGYVHGDALIAAAGQDADVILIDDFRDARSAAWAIELAADGRLVLAGMTGPDVPTCLATLGELCNQPVLLGSLLVGTVNRLSVRRLCPKCRVSDASDSVLRQRLGLDPAAETFAPAGCPSCQNIGYRGTVSLAAVTPASAAMRRALRAGEDADELARILRGDTPGLWGSAANLVRQGVTSLEEIARVAPMSGLLR